MDTTKNKAAPATDATQTPRPDDTAFYESLKEISIQLTALSVKLKADRQVEKIGGAA